MKANKEINTKHIGIGGIGCPCCYDRKIDLNKRARKGLKNKLLAALKIYKEGDV